MTIFRLLKSYKYKSYSKLIPRAWELIRIRINNQIFSELKKLLNQNFKKELNAN